MTGAGSVPLATHSLETSALVFAVSLLVGGVAIHFGAKFALKSENLSHAVLTALLGAIAWAVVDLLFLRIGVEGVIASIAGLIVWIWVIKWRYSVGWLRGSLLGLFAWLAALFVLGLLSLVGIEAIDAYGIPGT